MAEQHTKKRLCSQPSTDGNDYTIAKSCLTSKKCKKAKGNDPDGGQSKINSFFQRASLTGAEHLEPSAVTEGARDQPKDQSSTPSTDDIVVSEDDEEVTTSNNDKVQICNAVCCITDNKPYQPTDVITLNKTEREFSTKGRMRKRYFQTKWYGDNPWLKPGFHVYVMQHTSCMRVHQNNGNGL